MLQSQNIYVSSNQQIIRLNKLRTLIWTVSIESREKYFTFTSLKGWLFENVDATTVMDFIKEINFYHVV